MSEQSDSPSPRQQNPIEEAVSFFSQAKARLLTELMSLSGDPDRSSLYQDEVVYIRGAAQALVTAIDTQLGEAAKLPPSTPAPHPAEAVPQAELPPFSSSDSARPGAVRDTSIAAGPQRRPRSDAFDLCLLATVYSNGQLQYDVGLDVVYRVAVIFDPLAARASLIAKLNRWKTNGYLRWQSSRCMHVTPAGEAKIREFIRTCRQPDGGLDAALAAVKSGIGVSLDVEAILKAHKAAP